MKYQSISDEESRNEWTNVADYLKSFAIDSTHELRQEASKRIGYAQSSFPDRKVCDLGQYSRIDNFPIGPIEPARLGYKQLFDARKIGFGKEKLGINLGGHVAHPEATEMTRFGIIHYHFRCIEIGKCQ